MNRIPECTFVQGEGQQETPARNTTTSSQLKDGKNIGNGYPGGLCGISALVMFKTKAVKIEQPTLTLKPACFEHKIGPDDLQELFPI